MQAAWKFTKPAPLASHAISADCVRESKLKFGSRDKHLGDIAFCSTQAAQKSNQPAPSLWILLGFETAAWQALKASWWGHCLWRYRVESAVWHVAKPSQRGTLPLALPRLPGNHPSCSSHAMSIDLPGRILFLLSSPQNPFCCRYWPERLGCRLAWASGIGS